jgi:hypothetical protein
MKNYEQLVFLLFYLQNKDLRVRINFYKELNLNP